MAFGNYGFVGNFIILGIWGNEFFYKYSLFVFFVGILCNSWGLYTLIPKEQNMSIWKKLKKGLLTPPLIALLSGMTIGLLGLSRYVPDFIVRVFDNAGKCQGPVAMVLAGVVIGGYNFKSLFLNKKVYVASLLRLVVIPAVMMLVLKLLGINDEIMTLALIAFATPLGLNTIVYPAAYGGDTKTGASMAMISHTLSVVTIPLMYLIFIVLL
jgi:predicted permease